MLVQAILYNTEAEALKASESYYNKPASYNAATDTLYMFLVVKHLDKWAMCIDDTTILTLADYNKIEIINIEI